ncbi:MAG: serine hydrolase [Desulfobacterales bacterium]|jgi:CubicO group peptidase (beta-lactamase class C family)|nr:serine hydrolase [Desulfobacterales bacterium]
MTLESIDALMREAVEKGIFPGGALLFSKAGRVLFNEVYGYSNMFEGRFVAHDTLFDLASLTKPIATAMAVLTLIKQGRIKLEQTLGKTIGQFRNTSKAHIRISHLLCHNSGLPAYQPFFKEIGQVPPQDRKPALRNLLIQEPLASGIGSSTVYSDIGFMILEWVIETIAAAPLDQFLYQSVYDPLEITDLLYMKTGADLPKKEFAATEMCPWRHRLIQGEVHDENAYVMGGVAGHAGLFGTARSVHQLLSLLLAVFTGEKHHPLFQQDLVRLFLTPASDAKRALGFDTPSETGSSCGKLFNKDRTVGHLGFTGTSFWMDLNQAIIIILLTNRIHPTRFNEGIKTFRPMIHDAVMSLIMTSDSL